jgi:hypothetical protein
MAEDFAAYWRVRENVYRRMAAGCASEQEREPWLALAKSCACRAELTEQIAPRVTGIVSFGPAVASNEP